MLNLYDELDALVGALDRAKVPFALCGAIALAMHGHPRATKDIDMVVRREDLEMAKRVAGACGFVLEALPIKFASGIEVERISKITGSDLLMLDLLVVNELLWPVWESRRSLPWRDGRELSVVSREGLISMKLTAGRPQDLADLARLQESA
ncbi:MAG: hypothetical protein EXR72_09300 [Myxococcales bacterium]|nr:hypothetical protein [Myxococcales bacterium]